MYGDSVDIEVYVARGNSNQGASSPGNHTWCRMIIAPLPNQTGHHWPVR